MVSLKIFEMLLLKMAVYGSQCSVMVPKAVVSEFMQKIVVDFVSVETEF